MKSAAISLEWSRKSSSHLPTFCNENLEQSTTEELF